MDQTISMLILMLGIILVLSLINTVLGVVQKINMRNIFILALIMGAGFLFIKFRAGEIDTENGLTAAVVEQIEKAVPEYIDSGEKCSAIEEKEELGEDYKDEICKKVCKDQKLLGHKCMEDDKLFCKCW